MQEETDIDIVPGVVNCFICALVTNGDVIWQVELDGVLVPVSLSPDAVAIGNFLVIQMPDDYVPSGPSGRRNISCISLVDGQTIEARIVSMGERVANIVNSLI
jgi:hypothetical protein